MNSFRRSGRRIFGADDGRHASAASLLVEVSAGAAVDEGDSLADLLEQARKQGREEGYRAAASEMAAAEAAGRAAQLRRLADSVIATATALAETRRKVVSMAAAEAAELAYDLAQAFLQRELSVGRPAVEAVTRAMALAPEGEDLVVRLNPQEVLSAEELQEELVRARDATIRVVADPRVEPGGAVLTAGPCRIDTQLGSALERAQQLLDQLCAGAA
jgi:flagellar biosynthesis/type III secretory pathway protein FliH